MMQATTNTEAPASAPLNDAALDQLFRHARSAHHFSARAVSDETLRRLYDLAKLGPTSFNTQPARYVFVRSTEARQRLAPALSRGNRHKTLAAPVTVIVAFDTQFLEALPSEPQADKAKSLMEQVPSMIGPTAERNSTLQGAYLIMAARALGLQAGPMAGFDPKKVDVAFFPDRRYRTNFIVNLGYPGEPESEPRPPRLAFEAVAEIV